MSMLTWPLSIRPIAPIDRIANAIPGAGVWVLALVALALRVYAALPFWKSGLVKWEGETLLDKLTNLQLSDSVAFLFEHEFKIRQFGGEIDMPFPATMGLLSGIGEIILPILLFVGLFTRFAALGLIGMAVVIQLVYPTEFLLHGQWIALLILVLLVGPGRLSLDAILFGRR
jgi:putative oxidoreductase